MTEIKICLAVYVKSNLKLGFIVYSQENSFFMGMKFPPAVILPSIILFYFIFILNVDIYILCIVIRELLNK